MFLCPLTTPADTPDAVGVIFSLKFDSAGR